MRKRFPFAAAAVLAAGTLTLLAADKPKSLPAPLAADTAHANFINKVYAVADLVVPIPGMGAPVSPAKKDCDEECAACAGCLIPGILGDLPGADEGKANTCEDALMKMITNAVCPNQWSAAGGPCSMEYFPIGMALVVNAPAEVHEQVARMLESLRKLQDIQVAIELRFVTVTEDSFERIGVDFNAAPKCEAVRVAGPQQVTPCPISGTHPVPTGATATLLAWPCRGSWPLFRMKMTSCSVRWRVSPRRTLNPTWCMKARA